MPRELLSELSGLEAVGSGVLGEGAQHPTVENMARNLLEQQTPTRTEDPRDLGDGLLPLRNVVDDPKVDDGVERSGRVSNFGGVTGAEPQGLCGTIPQPPSARSTIAGSRSKAVTCRAPSLSSNTSTPTPRPQPTSRTSASLKSPWLSSANQAASR